VPEAILDRTETIAGCPKFCSKCGCQGLCTDSRRRSHAVMRAYECRCGHVWTTAETLLEEGTYRNDPRKFEHHQRRQAQRAVESLRKDLHAMIDTFFESQANPQVKPE
jgi:hypothetical protein